MMMYMWTILPQVFPGALLTPTYPDPANPGQFLGHSEVERRRDYIQPLCAKLGQQHPLLQLVLRCLDNKPANRPSAEELLQQLKAQIEEEYGRHQISVEIAKRQVAMMRVLRTKREEDDEIKHLRHDLQQAHVRAPKNDDCVNLLNIVMIIMQISYIVTGRQRKAASSSGC